MLPSINETTSDFPELLEGGFIYVDKTATLQRLIANRGAKFCFLARLRRFGKSLMLSTLKAIFQGHSELFEGLDEEDIEIICVDDESTDGSREILSRFAERDKRIRVIRQKNGGPGKAHNCGIEEARGEYLAFVDSDDWVDRFIWYRTLLLHSKGLFKELQEAFLYFSALLLRTYSLWSTPECLASLQHWLCAKPQKTWIWCSSGPLVRLTAYANWKENTRFLANPYTSPLAAVAFALDSRSTRKRVRARLKQCVPYELMRKGLMGRCGIVIDEPLMAYPGFFKRAKRLVKFVLPYGLVETWKRADAIVHHTEGDIACHSPPPTLAPTWPLSPRLFLSFQAGSPSLGGPAFLRLLASRLEGLSWICSFDTMNKEFHLLYLVKVAQGVDSNECC